MKTIKQNLYFFYLSFFSKNQFFILFLFLISTAHNLFAQNYNGFNLNADNNHNADTTIRVQYRRIIEPSENQLSYEQKYFGKDLNEVKRSLFPFESTGIWTELNPKVPRVDYIGVHFVNKDTGWACGDLGALIKTTNGGNSWTNSISNTTTPILKVRSYNGQIVIASGYAGTILRSTNGGESFVPVTSNVTGDLWGLQMINDTLGWACGISNSLTKTTDGGQTWQRILTPGYTTSYWWIDFMNENYGFIAADGKVLRTTDGGNNWEIIQAGDAYPLFCVDMIDSLHIAAAGYGGTGYPAKNIYSSDGGYNWVNGGFVTTSEINCVQYVNIDTGYIVQSDIGLYKTTNRGQSWISVNGDGGEYELIFVSENIGYNAGVELKLYKKESSFEIWTKLIINDNFTDVFFISENIGFAISSVFSYNQGLYKTENGGISWQRINDAPGGNDIVFTDSLTGFIATTNSTIKKTTDGGNTWYATNGITNNIAKIFFVNAQIGWAAGGYRVFKTTDGGENWFEQLYNVVAFFKSIYFVDSLYGWTANDDRPYKTIDGGINWIQQTNLDIWASRDIIFNSYTNGYLLESNKYYKTTNGGLSWSLDPNITGFSIAGRLNKHLDSTIFITGYHTYRTLDDGVNWIDYPELTGTKISGISLLSKGYGFAVGDLGLLLKYNDETIPVELTMFTGTIAGNTIQLSWRTATETNNLGFEIERKRINETWEKIDFIAGKGTTTQPQLYSYFDESLIVGRYLYRLKQIDYNNSFEYSNIIEIDLNSDSEFELYQNYPNPFNPETSISYNVSIKSHINISLFNITGEKLQVLIDEEQQPGYYNIKLKGGILSSGIYFYKLSTNSGYTDVKKLTIIK